MSHATYTQDGDIGVITLDDGKANAMSPEMSDAINAALDPTESDTKAVLLTGRESARLLWRVPRSSVVSQIKQCVRNPMELHCPASG